MKNQKYQIIEDFIETLENNEIKNKFKLFVKDYNRVNKQLDKIIKISDKQQLDLRNLNNELSNKKDKIQFLLDNSNRGFFSFGKKLLIDKEYSSECRRIFKQDISDQKVADILYIDDKKRDDFLYIISKIFNESIKFKKEIYLSLLESEIFINNKFYDIEYKLIKDDNEIMIILKDITNEKSLKEQIEKEQLKFKFIVTVLQNREEFLEIIDEYKNFINLIKSEKLSINEIYRQFHTFKGNFSQLNFIHLPESFHSIETIISSNIENNITSVDINFDELENNFQKDLAIITETLGEMFFNQEKYYKIDENRLLEIDRLVDYINKNIPSTNQEILQICEKIKQIRYINIKNLILPHIKYIMQKANSLNINLSNPKITGNDILVDTKIYTNFFKSLIHIYTNIISHAIESLDVRILHNKDEFATIITNIKQENNNIILEISDDGRGIDIDKLKKVLINKNFKDIDKLNEDEILNYIFIDTISTSDNVDNLKGRGVGLSAIKYELDKINGKIEVKTKKDIGTKFIFTIPIINNL